MSEQPRIFVSHAKEDGDFSDKLVVALRAAGADVWFAEHNFPQGRIRETIERELLARKVLILVLSPSALASKWVRDETEWFYDLLQEDSTRVILPILAHPISRTELWLFIRQFKRIETEDGKPLPEDVALKLTLAALNLTQPAANANPTMVVQFADDTFGNFETTDMGRRGQMVFYRSTDDMYIYAASNGQSKADSFPEVVMRRLAPIAFAARNDPYWRDIFAAVPDKRAVQPRSGLRMRLIKGPGWHRMDAHMYASPFYWEDLDPTTRITFPNRLQVAIKIAEGIDYLEANEVIQPNIGHLSFMVNLSGFATLLDLQNTLGVGESPEFWDTSAYRAPELISRRSTLNVLTTRHALAVLFYKWFLGPHPLEGNHLLFSNDPRADDELRFGDRALYIEHPTDHSNWRTNQLLKSHMLGSDLENIFRQAFVEGLRQPARRPSPREFVIALHRAADLVIPCAKPDCDWHAFVAEPTAPPTCPRCSTPYKRTKTLAYLRIPDSRQSVVAWEHKVLVGWHVRSDVTPIHRSPADATNAIPQAMFEYSQHDNQWLLCNLALPEMAYSSSEGWQTWQIGEVKPLIHDMRIRFGPEPQYHQAICTIASTGA